MKKVGIVSLGPRGEDQDFQTEFLGQAVEVQWFGTDGNIELAKKKIQELDGAVDVIGLDSMNRAFQVGGKSYPIEEIERVARDATKTPVVDGSHLKETLERWAIARIHEKFPEVLRPTTHVFIPCGAERWHMAKVLSEYTEHIEFGDAMMHYGWPWPIHGLPHLERYAEWFLDWVVQKPYKALYPTGKRQEEVAPKFARAFRKAGVIAGGLHYIRRYAPENLRNAMVITNSLSDSDIEELRNKGVRAIFTTTPEMNGRSYGQNVLEAIMVATSKKRFEELRTEDFLRMISDSKIQLRVIYPQGKPVEERKFAFVIHPLSLKQVRKHKYLRYVSWLPDSWLHWFVGKLPPIMPISHVKGARSATGVELKGWLYALPATPRALMDMSPRDAYKKILRCAEHAETTGAGIMGLGAFTSVVGDAGITIAKEADIPITSGNSYTVASTMEAAKTVCRKMGHDPDEFTTMIIGATGSIGAVCSKLLGYVSKRLHLVAPRPEKLLELQRKIQETNPHCKVTVSQHSNDFIGDADLIITTTTSRGAKLIDMMKVKPGAVICDVARPLDMKKEDGDLRPDVLIIESGELEVPGPVDFGTDIGLPPKTAYACLSETMILAMEGRYEDYTLGRNLDIDKVKEIYKLGKKHGFKLAAIRSFGSVISDGEIQLIRERANDARKRQAVRDGTEAKLLVPWELPAKPTTSGT
jgi:predicted amino acid dehydrogenase